MGIDPHVAERAGEKAPACGDTGGKRLRGQRGQRLHDALSTPGQHPDLTQREAWLQTLTYRALRRVIATLGGDLDDLPDITDPTTDWLHDVEAYQALERSFRTRLTDTP